MSNLLSVFTKREFCRILAKLLFVSVAFRANMDLNTSEGKILKWKYTEDLANGNREI